MHACLSCGGTTVCPLEGLDCETRGIFLPSCARCDPVKWLEMLRSMDFSKGHDGFLALLGGERKPAPEPRLCDCGRKSVKGVRCSCGRLEKPQEFVCAFCKKKILTKERLVCC